MGGRRHVVPASSLPRNWHDFLHVDENKTELFSFLSKLVIENTFGKAKQIVVTDGSSVKSTSPVPDENLLMLVCMRRQTLECYCTYFMPLCKV